MPTPNDMTDDESGRLTSGAVAGTEWRPVEVRGMSSSMPHFDRVLTLASIAMRNNEPRAIQQIERLADELLSADPDQSAKLRRLLTRSERSRIAGPLEIKEAAMPSRSRAGRMDRIQRQAEPGFPPWDDRLPAPTP